MKKTKPWETHYKRLKSVLLYPDENLVRMLKSYISSNQNQNITAIDLGCGSGRHLSLLSELGVEKVIGLDNSINALSLTNELYRLPLVQGDNTSLSFKENSFDIIISWGSLHYCKKDLLNKQLKEIHGITKKHGRLFGTLRSINDTYLKRGKDLGGGTWITDIGDIKDQVVSFYSEDELRFALNIFNVFEYGIMERTIIGDMEKIISHWVFWAEK